MTEVLTDEPTNIHYHEVASMHTRHKAVDAIRAAVFYARHEWLRDNKNDA